MAAPSPLEQIKAFFTRYTLQQKLALAGSAALVLILLWVLVYFVNRVEYQTLYADVDPQEAQGIVVKLQELKVPYELAPDGRTVKVASDKLAEVRIQLASQGLPESGCKRSHCRRTFSADRADPKRCRTPAAKFDRLQPGHALRVDEFESALQFSPTLRSPILPEPRALVVHGTKYLDGT